MRDFVFRMFSASSSWFEAASVERFPLLSRKRGKNLQAASASCPVFILLADHRT